MVRVIERQDRGKNCPAAIFTPRQPDVSPGPRWLGKRSIRARTWVHQNRAILCGCGGDFYRSPKNRAISLSFFSLMFLFPWCFSCWEFAWSFWVYSAYFPRFLGVRQVRKILGVFEVFLGIFEKTKEKKDRVLEAPTCAISSAKKIASEPRFLQRIKWVKMVLAAEFPAIPLLCGKNR